MAVSVVNEYAATSLLVLVIFDKNVDLPWQSQFNRLVSCLMVLVN